MWTSHAPQKNTNGPMFGIRPIPFTNVALPAGSAGPPSRFALSAVFNRRSICAGWKRGNGLRTPRCRNIGLERLSRNTNGLMLRVPLEKAVWEVCRTLPRKTVASVAERSLIAMPQEGRHGWMAFEYLASEFKKKDIAVVVLAYPRHAGISRYLADPDFSKKVSSHCEISFDVQDRAHDLILQPTEYNTLSECYVGFLKDIRDPRAGFWVLSKAHGNKGWFPKTDDEKPKPEQPRRPGPVGPLQGPRSR